MSSTVCDEDVWNEVQVRKAALLLADYTISDYKYIIYLTMSI